MDKNDRILEIFYRGLKGEDISVKKLADEHGVSKKSISRDITDIKMFLAENRDLTGNTELKYDYSSKVYRLEFDEFLLSKELISIIKILIGSRTFSENELLKIVGKLKAFTTVNDRKLMDRLIQKEIALYKPVHRDSQSLIDNIWKLTNTINAHKEITITYYKMSRELVTRRLKPVSIMFSEYYFYLIAYDCAQSGYKPKYFRVDRITKIVEHREIFELEKKYDFNEGALREKILLMFPGELRKITFEFSGPSLEAIKDKLPTARVVELRGRTAKVEAEVYGDGIKMFLLSQGDWVKVLSPQSFVEEMKETLEKMMEKYK